MLENTPTIFKVPVYPHIKKFLAKKYKRTVAQSEIRISGNQRVYSCEEYTVLGKLVKLTLMHRKEKIHHLDQFRNRLTENILLKLTSHQARLSPRIKTLININDHLDTYFKESLLSYIKEQDEDGVPPFNACRNFLEKYGIDENEYSLDAAYKYWQRSGK